MKKNQLKKNLVIKEVITPKKNIDVNVTEFDVIVNFPELAGPLKTKEERLGIYSSFLQKTIGSFYAENLAYLGERELEYDAKGGTIKNREVLSVYESCMRVLMPAKKVTIEYTTKGPYAMIYEANDGADYYAFKITHPRKDLEKSFSGSYTSGKIHDHLPEEILMNPKVVKGLSAKSKIPAPQAKQPLFSKNRYELRSNTIKQDQCNTSKEEDVSFLSKLRLH